MVSTILLVFFYPRLYPKFVSGIRVNIHRVNHFIYIIWKMMKKVNCVTEEFDVFIILLNKSVAESSKSKTDILQ